MDFLHSEKFADLQEWISQLMDQQTAIRLSRCITARCRRIAARATLKQPRRPLRI